MKVLTFLSLIMLGACASNKAPEVEAIYFCKTLEWEYIFRIYEDYKIARCMESTRIRNGHLMLDPIERTPDMCKKAIEKEAKKNRCCLISKTPKYGEVSLPKCKDAIVDSL